MHYNKIIKSGKIPYLPPTYVKINPLRRPYKNNSKKTKTVLPLYNNNTSVHIYSSLNNKKIDVAKIQNNNKNILTLIILVFTFFVLGLLAFLHTKMFHITILNLFLSYKVPSFIKLLDFIIFIFVPILISLKIAARYKIIKNNKFIKEVNIIINIIGKGFLILLIIGLLIFGIIFALCAGMLT